MLREILYLENSDKARFSDLKKRVENDYVLNKAEYPRTMTAVKSLLLNYQHNYKSNRNSQSNGVSNQIMFTQGGENGDDKGDGKHQCLKIADLPHTNQSCAFCTFLHSFTKCTLLVM